MTRIFLILAFILLPFNVGLSGDMRNSPVVFGLSDVLVLLAIPGAIRAFRKETEKPKWAGLLLPTILYVGVGTFSFALNAFGNSQHWLPHLSSFVRTAQIVLLLPWVFSSVYWTSKDLTLLQEGYLLSVTFLSICGLIAFSRGTQAGLYVMGEHKNVVGLSTAIGVICALILFPRRAEEENSGLIPRWGLVVCALLCGLTLACSLSRSSYIAFVIGSLVLALMQRRAVPLFGIGIVLISIFGVYRVLPQKSANYLVGFSTERYNIAGRTHANQVAFDRFKEKPVFGDGFRTRKEVLPHNMVISSLAETGIVGTLLLFWVIFAQMRWLLQSAKRMKLDTVGMRFRLFLLVGSLMVLVHSQFDPFWRRGPVWLLWVGSGILISYLQEQNQRAL
ncbi:MAG: O-antigen ligase family protein [Chthonomonadaceae bacterium]|nr:O-antigen ligase family protein [Chthonomonadaceae bacterium]